VVGRADRETVGKGMPGQVPDRVGKFDAGFHRNDISCAPQARAQVEVDVVDEQLAPEPIHGLKGRHSAQCTRGDEAWHGIPAVLRAVALYEHTGLPIPRHGSHDCHLGAGQCCAPQQTGDIPVGNHAVLVEGEHPFRSRGQRIEPSSERAAHPEVGAEGVDYGAQCRAPVHHRPRGGRVVDDVDAAALTCQG